MHPTTQILQLVYRYMGARNIAASTLSRLACGCSTVIDRLPTGRVTIRTVDRLVQYCSDNWPEGLEWFAAIPRPPVTPLEPEEAPAGDEAAPVGADGQVEEPVT